MGERVGHAVGGMGKWLSSFLCTFSQLGAETREGNTDEAKCALRQRSKTDIAGRDIRCAVIE